MVLRYKMAALQIIAFMLFTVTLFGEGFDMTDVEFQVGFIVLEPFRSKF